MNDFLGRSGAYERFVHKLHFYTGFELVICSSTKPVDGAIVHKLKSFISSILCGASREWIFSFRVIRVFGAGPPPSSRHPPLHRVSAFPTFEGVETLEKRSFDDSGRRGGEAGCGGGSSDGDLGGGYPVPARGRVRDSGARSGRKALAAGVDGMVCGACVMNRCTARTAALPELSRCPSGRVTALPAPPCARSAVANSR